MSVRRCIALFGGSFDPPHHGHVALVRYFATLLAPDELHIVPAGQPWQKTELQTPAAHRVAMARLAFANLAVPVAIDEQEVRRSGPTYTIDTLRAVRAEAGPEASVAFLMGADQLQKLHTWKDWQQLFSLAHLCVASRPGFAFDDAHLPPEVARECARRAAGAEQIRNSPAGLMFLANGLHVDLSATGVRAALKEGRTAAGMLPDAVLDYARQHHLYET